MSRIQTMGAHSCACIAIAGFNVKDMECEDDYVEKGIERESEGYSLDEFYDKILYPTAQKLGTTKEYAFSHLMGLLKKSPMNTKFTIAVLAEFQLEYWEPKLVTHGFTRIDKTYNDIGTWNYIYTRNLNRDYVEDDEDDY